MAAATPAATLQAAHLSRGRSPVLDGVTLELMPATLTVLLGDNGSGKTTLLDLLAGLLKPQAGSLQICGGHPNPGCIAHLPPPTRVDWAVPLSVGEVAAIDLPRTKLLGRLTAEARARRDRVLAEMGLTDRAGEPIARQSAGLRQRAQMARILARDPPPKLVLLDEPLAALDGASTERVIAGLESLRASGSAILAAHHPVGRDALIARADRVLRLVGGQIQPHTLSNS